jgi:branched-chain amino acid transport system permease protein
VQQFLGYTFSGLSLGAIYAVAAAGLVLTYTTTGTFNFAHGAVGMFAAFVYWQMRFAWHWPAPVCLFVCLLVLAPLFGAALDIGIMRRLEGTPETTRLVVTISILVGLLGAAVWIWNPSTAHPVEGFWQGRFVSVDGARVSYHQAASLVIAVAVAVGLRLLLYRARVGIAMRAAVDDPALAQLNGARSRVASLLAWAIGSSLAALSGILISPTLTVSAVPLTLLIVNAYAAAMIGRLRSLPYTVLGAVILGLLSNYVPDYLRPTHISKLGYLDGLYISIPVIVLFVALLVLPNPRLRGHTATRAKEIVLLPTVRGALLFSASVVAGAAMVAAVVSQTDLETIARIFGIGIVALSFVPLIGYAGQISLCQLSFAGIGAVVMAHAGAHGNPLGLVAAIVVAGAVGAVVALPALRLSGIYLALATAAFAVILDQWIFQFPAFSVFGHHFDIFQAGSLNVPRPKLFGLRFEGQKAEFVLMATAFALCAMIVVAIRRSQFGFRLLAMKDSPAACATLGLNLTRTKLTVFAMSAALAGFGAAMYGGALRVTSSQQFDFFTGLPMLLLMVVAGIATVGGALACGISLGSPVLTNLFPHLTELTLVLAGLAGIGMGRNPNGFVLELRQRWQPMLTRPVVGVGVAAALFAAWLLRVEHVVTSWPYVGISAAILVAVPGIDLLTNPSQGAKEDVVPLEWLGITRPYRPEDLVMLDRALALGEPGPHGTA